ncbi:MAG: UDP-N-acetylmuramoyl-tripeptide--D-alanyl-D-alanine ligase [Erysipelothrix sp.]|nr:UDP-N-acetylmuramoyl-tripeptide--D-alanyl-D-alanine ligase [Erysipelothrix sp.]
MNKMSTVEIGNLLGAEVLNTGYVKGVNVDTRLVKEDDLFVCLVGERVDGHDFAQEAIDNGAKALLVSRRLDLDIPQILVSDTLEALFSFARIYRKSLDMEVIAITGSNGKTSTKDMLLSVCSNVAPTVATFENQNTAIGSCLTLFKCDSKTRYGIFEMGLDAPKEIDAMVNLVYPTSAILTSLDQAHMDNFEDDYEVLGKEKFSIFNNIKDKSKCFYQGDVAIYRKLASDEKSFGFNEDNDYVITDVEVQSDKTSFKLNQRDYAINLLGQHQASNAAGVISLLRSLGFNDDIINKGLEDIKLTAMRTEIYKYKGATILFDAYKSSPKSLLAILDLFGQYTSTQKRYAVLADMYMLGKGTEAHHQEALKKALEQDIEVIYLLGDEFEKAMHHFNDKRLKHFKDKEALDKELQALFKEGNFILFKGSRYYALETLMKED